MTGRNSKMYFWNFVSLVLALGGPGSLGITSDVKRNIDPGVRAPSHEAIATCQYTMTARVRLLLFWISRQDVGGGRIAWSEGMDGSQVVELLIGSDPERAPMRINRWGYISERVAGSSAELVGVMTESEEASIEQAKIAVSRSGTMHSFKGIRSSVTQGFAQSTVLHLLLPEDFTYRTADALLRQLPQKGGPIRQVRIPDGTEPGFLYALKGLIHDSVGSLRRSGQANAERQSRCCFVYAGSLYELTRRSSQHVQEDTINGRTYHGAIKSEFETRNLASGELSKFSITYGSQSPFTEIPIRIVYRPRWWFEAELLLAGKSEAAEEVGRETAWTLGTK